MLPMLPQFLTLTWSLVAVQIVGLLSAWAVRRSEGSRHQSTCYGVFYFCLVLVALTAMVSFSVGPGERWLAEPRYRSWWWPASASSTGRGRSSISR